MRGRLFLFASMAAITGCGGGGTETAIDAGVTGGGGGGAGDAVNCLLGFWTEPESDCQVACPGAPECTATDCKLVTYLGLRDGGISYQGAVTVSASAGTLSCFGGPGQLDTWAFSADGGLKIAANGQAVRYRCSFQSLDLDLFTKSRATPRLALALDQSISTGACTQISY